MQSSSDAMLQVAVGPRRDRLPRKPDGKSVAEKVCVDVTVNEYTASGPLKPVVVQRLVEASLKRFVSEPEVLALPPLNVRSAGPVQLSPEPLEAVSEALKLKVPVPKPDVLSTHRKYVPAARGALVTVAVPPVNVAALQAASDAVEQAPAALRDNTGRQLDAGEVGVTVAENTWPVVAVKL